MVAHAKKSKGVLLWTGASLLGLLLLWLFLQFVSPHFTKPFRPDYARVDLSPILAQETLSQEDYRTLFDQTGLGKAAIDDLLAQGEAGIEQILNTQEGFFVPPGEASCAALGVTTREHRFRDEEGYILYAAPLAPLEPGDILVSFSTHTAGWNHGHAGLVLDPDKGVTLESVVLGSLSSEMNVNHWRSYSTWMALRPKADAQTREQVVQIARERLTEIPYSLVSGAFGDKFQPLDGPHNAHCGYLPWYAWMAAGVDLDGDGGRIVAPADLADSENVEIVQVYGIDPTQIPLPFED